VAPTIKVYRHALARSIMKKINCHFFMGDRVCFVVNDVIIMLQL